MASPEEIRDLLKIAIWRGLLAVHLNARVPEIVDIICPAHSHPTLSPLKRAVEAEEKIRTYICLSVEQFGESVLGDQLYGFLLIVLGLDDASVPNRRRRQTTPGKRLEAAADLVGICPKTARKHRDFFIDHLALLLHKRLFQAED